MSSSPSVPRPTAPSRSTPPALTTAQSDRAAGVLMGLACGDALGAPHEFHPALDPSVPLGMTGGGSFGWEPGEWTDDTQMAVVVLQAAEHARDEGLALLDVLDDVAAGWSDWSLSATDVGSQTASVLSAARRNGRVTADAVRDAARVHHEQFGRSAGNGSLMRTAPVALAYLGDEEGMVAAARGVSDLTHHELDAGDACVLWCAAIRHAVLNGELGLRDGLRLLPAERRATWAARIDEAESARPVDFPKNGWVVHAFQSAWAAIAGTLVPAGGDDGRPADHLVRAIENAVRCGGDTDTVAAIAGSLLGARWGASAVPVTWRRVVHGWPGLTVTELGLRGFAVATGTRAGSWPLVERMDYAHVGARGRLVRHPHDDGVVLGDAALLDDLPEGIDAVVSLCRVGTARPGSVAARDHVAVWLSDEVDPAKNPNLDHVLEQAADAVAALRGEGRTVLLHCAAGQSRTPTVGAAYAVRHCGVAADVALDEVAAVLPDPQPNDAFRDAIRRVRPVSP